MADHTDVHPENDMPPNPNPIDSRLSLANLNISTLRAQPNRQSTIDAHTRWAARTATKESATLIMAHEFERVKNECEDLVDRITQDCRDINERFRDTKFDIGGDDSDLCLYGLLGAPSENEKYEPKSVSRVTEIFENPEMFQYIDIEKTKINPNDIRQGGIGDCWFVSALAVVANMPDLLERLFVKHDKDVGVYGFMFFRDGEWTKTIIDDQLFEANKQFDQLDQDEKKNWHGDRQLYEETKLRGSRALYFASAAHKDETWVPLYEKAYAKAHGDYGSLYEGHVGEAIEDLTGGVSTLIKVKDILNAKLFWTEELMKVNDDRLFACYIDDKMAGDLTGLIADHAYSILEAKEVEDTDTGEVRRFLVIRNPWGEDGEWKGAWSDGAPEWTWERMRTIGHQFGNDGCFVMEYSDFLKVWQTVDRCRLFEKEWALSQCHVQVKVRPWPAAPTFGDVSFTVTVTKKTDAIFVLSQHDTRYFRGLQGFIDWGLEFRVFKQGETEPKWRSKKGPCGQRSVNVEARLEPGTYIVHVRIDRQAVRKENFLDEYEISVPKLARVAENLNVSKRKAPNYDWVGAKMEYLSPPSSVYDGRPLSEIHPDVRGKSKAESEEGGEKAAEKKEDDSVKLEMEEDIPDDKTVHESGEAHKADLSVREQKAAEEAPSAGSRTVDDDRQGKTDDDVKILDTVALGAEKEGDDGEHRKGGQKGTTSDQEWTAREKEEALKAEERKKADSVFVFLRVYSLDREARISAETRL